MHQQTYCHTLSKPFFKIFLFRIYAPTIHSTDIDFDETSAPVYTHLRAHPASTNQSTNDTAHTHTHNHRYTLHKYHNHTASTNTYSLHKHPQTPTRRSHGPRRCRCNSTSTLIAGRMQSQPRTSLQLDRPDRQDQARPKSDQDQARSDQIEPHQIDEYQTGRVQFANFSAIRPWPDKS